MILQAEHCLRRSGLYALDPSSLLCVLEFAQGRGFLTEQVVKWKGACIAHSIDSAGYVHVRDEYIHAQC